MALKIFTCIAIIGLFVFFIGFTVNEFNNHSIPFFRAVERLGTVLLYGGGFLTIASFLLTQ